MIPPSAALPLCLILLATGCSREPAGPAALEPHQTCATCRMRVIDRRFAAQVNAPGCEPKFFDDVGCLRTWLAAPSEKAPWAAWVSDHRTRRFIPAATAVFTSNPAVQTPMNSGILAHADAASRDQDPAARGGTPIPPAAILGAFTRRGDR